MGWYQNNPASKWKNTDVLCCFPAPKCWEIHSELSDWISKSSTGKLQPFSNIYCYFRRMGQRQHKLLLLPLSLPFQSLKNVSSRPTAASGVKRYNRAEATPLHSHYHSDWSFYLSEVRQMKTQASDGEDTWREEEFISPFFSPSWSPFISADVLSVRSSPRRRPYFSRKQSWASDEKMRRKQ